MADDDSPYDFAPDSAKPAEPKRTALPGKPRPPTKLSPPIVAKPAGSGPAAAAPAPDAVERSCPHCGFLFYGKPRARCPECAAPLDSSAADMLQFSDLGWVRTVALGATLVIPGILLHMTGAVVRWFDQPLKGIFHASGALVLLIGVWLATRREPGKQTMGAALGARVAALLATLVWIALGMSARRMIHFEDFTLRMIVGAAMALHVLLSVPLGFHLNRLALRIPDDSIASHLSHCGWLCAIASGLMLILKILDVTGPDHLGIFMCSFPIITAFLVIFIWAMISLMRLNLNMRAAASAGEAIAYKRAERLANRKKPA